MQIENIDKVRILISKRNTLLEVVEKFEKWKNGHFEFTEHCGEHPNRISIINYPEMEEKMIGIIRDEIAVIENELLFM